MMMKYRVHEVARDLGVPSKDIINMLGQFFEGPHKHMTALTEEELDVVFEHYTKEKAVESFDSYFSLKKPAEKRAEPPVAKAETPAAKAPTEQHPAAQPAAQAVPPAAAQPVDQPEAPKPQPQPQQSVQQPSAQAQRPQNRPQQAQQRGQFPQRSGQPRQGQPQRPGQRPQRPFNQSGRPNQPNRQAQAPARLPSAPRMPQTPGNAVHQNPGQKQEKHSALERGTRVVDTRTSNVELDKYNEHYEQIAPQSRKMDNVQNKQKIKQKSNDRRQYPSKRESDADKLRRIQQAERQKKQQIKVSIPDEITVGELAARMKMTAAKVIKKLMELGVMASISQAIDYDTAALAAIELGAKVEKEIVVTIEDRLIDTTEDKDENLKPRGPVVVVMGHVDHGKTSLLDAIRDSNVVASEAGGITQHIGASRVKVGQKMVTFLDTPGHEAFTAMRARGAQITDIAVLVVAADDGIMPQTIEAINHAKAANISIIVAINKIDKPGANPERVMQELTEYGLIPEEWGGETICVPVSAVQHTNLDKLLEMILLVSEMKELKANPDRDARGVVIEAKLDKGRGPVASVLVQNGTLKIGDVVIAGTAVGRVRSMLDDRGSRVETAGPSVPVEITGLAEVPEAGDIFHVVQDERMARELVEQRRTAEKEEHFNAKEKITLDNLFDQMQLGDTKELSLIVKADVQGSVEAVTQSLEKLSTEEVRVSVIHSGVGAITESDVMLAQASKAIIIGFNVRPDNAARDNAEISNVEIRTYRIIYDCLEEIKSALKGMLAPKTREVQLGRIEVRHVYKISSVGTIAGSYVTEGKVTRNTQIRVVRDGIVIAEDNIASLKRFKDDAKEVQQGYECGIGLEKFNDIKEGDVFEAFIIEEYKEE